MSRRKRSNEEVNSRDEAALPAAEEHPSSSDEDDNVIVNDQNNLQTPSKKVRLNLVGGGGSVAAEEESKAVAYVAAGSQHNLQAVITPGVAARRHRDAAADASSLSASDASISAAPDTTATTTVDSAVRRSLFTPKDAKPQLVTPSRSATTTVQSPAKRRLVFGRYTNEVSVDENVRKVYNLIRKLTGSIGGNASHGPIYGELTMGSMQKMVNLMKEHTNFNESSRFIDVGSGIGKPNFHVAHDPGVAVSYGLEVDADRWLLSMNCLRGTLTTSEGGKTLSNGEAKAQRCVFVRGDIRDAKTFDPFTHVYMFSIGFPPALWVNLAEIWNQSASPYLICFHGPKDIVDSYEFDVELVAQVQTSMHGSKEGHTGYVYRRGNQTGRQKISKPSPGAPPDPLFVDGIQTAMGGPVRLKEWVERTLDEKMQSGPSTRTRRRISAKT